MKKINIITLNLSLLISVGCTNSKDLMGVAFIKNSANLGSSTGGPTPGPSVSPTPTPGGGPQPTATPPAGPENGKIFVKSPVFVAQSNIAYGTSVTSTTPEKNFDQYLSGAFIHNYKNNKLENDDIIVSANSSLQRATPDASGNWNFPSSGDPNKRLSQLMAFYWINEEKEIVERALPGAWHPSGQGIPVQAHCKDMMNAYWSGGEKKVCMGYRGPFESAYDASVFSHEMGHANLDYATNGQIYSNSSDTTCTISGRSVDCCPNAEGCISAINEGQADVHAYLVFGSGILAEFFMNSTTGFSERNGDLNKDLTSDQRYNGGGYGKEIHSMGGVWGAAWWTLYKDIGAVPTTTLFFSSLELLDGPDTFRTALKKLLTTNQQLLSNGKISKSYEAEIKAAFNHHGITPSP